MDRLPTLYRVRPRKPPEHAHPLVKQFFREMDQRQAQQNVLCEVAGLATSTVEQWRYKTNPTIINFDAALNALGLELCIRERT